MSVDSAVFLKPSIRAKLHDAGVISVSELRLICEASTSRRRTGDESDTMSANRMLCMRCPSLTAEEASLVVKQMECEMGPPGSLHCSRPKQNNIPETRPNSSSESPADPKQTQSSSTTSSPFQTFSLRDLMQGEHKRSRNDYEDDNSGNNNNNSDDNESNSPLISTQNSADLGPPSIPTFSRAFDELLGGRGLPCGELMEVAGPPGVGKTQLLMQLAVSSLLPEEFGGLSVFIPASTEKHSTHDLRGCSGSGSTTAPNTQKGTLKGSCLFVDTEGSFVATRYREIALAAVVHVCELASHPLCSPKRGMTSDAQGGTTVSAAENGLDDASRIRGAADAFSLDFVLANTYILQVNTLVDLLSLVHSLPVILGTHDHLGFVAIDSIAFPFRSSTSAQSSSSMAASSAPHVGSQYTSASGAQQLASGLQLSRPSESAALLSSFTLKTANRSRLLFLCGQQLQKHAREWDVAIAVSNHVTTRRIPMRTNESVRRPYSEVRKRQRSVSTSWHTAAAGGNRAQGSTEGIALRKEDRDDCVDDDDDEGEEDGSDSSHSEGEEIETDVNSNFAQRRLGLDETVAVLVPALGDLWACSPSLRILLGNRHQRDCASQDARRIHNNLDTSSHNGTTLCLYDHGQGGNASLHVSEELTLVSAGTGVSQHRVARILKHPLHPRGLECCFVINQRGIRNAEGIATQFLDA